MFTIYRPTTTFMNSLNSDEANLNLHRDRTSFKDSTSTRPINAIREMVKSNKLIPAAKVNCTKDNLFEKTNSIVSSWLNNKEVETISQDAFMNSTQVGDIFKNDEGDFFVFGPYSIDPFTI